MALQGTLDTFALADVLRLLAATRKTGRLRISGGRGSGNLWVDDGAIAAIEAIHAPHATDPVEALFELLRFTEGSFSFDADARHDEPGPPRDVEELLGGAEALLAEWREIEAVVPSLDAWVTLRRTLSTDEVTISQSTWTTLVAVGAGATVRRMGEELCLPELPISRAVRDLVTLGLVDLAPEAPAGAVKAAVARALTEPRTSPHAEPDEADHDAELPAAAVSADDTVSDAEAEGGPLPVARPIRAHRARPRLRAEDDPGEPQRFVPLDLPVPAMGSYDPPQDEDGDEGADPRGDVSAAEDLAAAFPGLASRSADPSPEDEELARQLATLSPRAAEAIRAAAEATTDEERDAALDEVVEGENAPINRGLLLKFLSSVKG